MSCAAKRSSKRKKKRNEFLFAKNTENSATCTSQVYPRCTGRREIGGRGKEYASDPLERGNNGGYAAWKKKKVGGGVDDRDMMMFKNCKGRNAYFSLFKFSSFFVPHPPLFAELRANDVSPVGCTSVPVIVTQLLRVAPLGASARPDSRPAAARSCDTQPTAMSCGLQFLQSTPVVIRPVFSRLLLLPSIKLVGGAAGAAAAAAAHTAKAEVAEVVPLRPLLSLLVVAPTQAAGDSVCRTKGCEASTTPVSRQRTMSQCFPLLTWPMLLSLPSSSRRHGCFRRVHEMDRCRLATSESIGAADRSPPAQRASAQSRDIW